MSEKDGKSTTRSGIPVEETYWPREAGERARAESELGRPGEFPFVRGVQKDMYRGRLWTMRQYAGFATAEESNQRYHYLLAQGTMGLSVAFDLPTQLGFDPDHARSRGEVGKVGVSIAHMDEMRVLMRGIDLGKVSTSMTINATAGILLALYAAVAEENGTELSALRGTVQNDVLKEYVARGNYIYPPEGTLRLTTDLFDWCARKAPKWNPISISGYHIREAGSTAVQELAFTFANAIAYCDAAIAQGQQIDAFAKQMSFFFNVHNDFFEEIAKFRAARKIWARILRERFGSQDPRAQMLRFHSQTAGSTLTAQQPENNAVRVTLQALAAVLGGTQSLHTNSMDEALALPTEASAKLALRTQQIIGAESGVAQTVDPLAGSYFVEQLTREIEERTFEYLARIDAQGGTVACIASGFIQTEISNAAYSDQIKMDRGELQVVGVNCYRDEAGSVAPKRELLRVSEQAERSAVERMKAYRAKRSEAAAQDALRAVEQSAQGSANLQDAIFHAVKQGATLGEISDRLRAVFGVHREFSGF